MRAALFLIPHVLACFALLPQAKAACQEGCGPTDHANTFLGEDALLNTTTGFDNTAVGFQALFSSNAIGNTATGAYTLDGNTTGSDNTATGAFALGSNTTGSRNVAIGKYALDGNKIGIDNTATGVNALYANTGNYNTATGYRALEGNTTGSNNTANGLDTLSANTIGSNNTSNGAYALYVNTTGSNNTALGQNALSNNAAGSSNIAVGTSAGSSLTSGSNNIYLAALGASAESNAMRLGKNGTQKNTYIAGVSGVTVPGGIGMVIDTSGHVGTSTSSARYKEQIRPMDRASEAILSLQPVSFRYKKELDPKATPQFGLVAEQVEKVNPDLIARDEEGKPYTVRYEAVNAMLLNEFLKAHRKIEEQAHTNQEQDATIRELKSTIAELQSAVKAQALQIQKVSDQFINQASIPPVVADN